MRDKKIPTIIGVILLSVILFLGVYLSLKRTTTSSRASTSCEPINPQITNLTYGSFDFSFITATACPATLVIENKIYQDSSSSSSTHYFKISNLSPETNYQFKIISGSTQYSRPEFNFVTAKKPNSAIPSSNLAWGRVLDANSRPVAGAIIYLTLPGSQALSAFSNKDGNWNISFATSFNNDKTDWFNPASPLDEDIIVYSPDAKITQITNRSDNNDPVPDIIIGQNSLSSLPTATPTLAVSLGSGPLLASSPNLSLTSPKESETINTLKPDIFGQGPAAASFNLSLDDRTVTVTIAQDNTWHWSPSENLSIGSHQLVLSYQSTKITRSFNVSQNENSLAFTSTPSATLVPSTLPTQKTTPSPTGKITSVPTKTPTLAPTLKPTKIPTLTSSPTSTSSTLYQSGNIFPTFFLILIASSFFTLSFFYLRR